MKKIITAMGNPTLNNELKKYAEYDVLGDDLFYQDAVLDFLENEGADILTLSGVLQGQWELNEFIDKVRKANGSIKIIIVMDEIDSEIKCGLLERGIQDIFLDETVEVSDIINAINREEPLRKKLEKSKLQLAEPSEEKYDFEEKVVIVKECQKQEIIAINGINGIGKTTIAYNLSRVLSNKSNSKILVIDFDTLSGNLEELFDVNKVPANIDVGIDMDKRCGLNYAADLIAKNRFDSNVFDEIVVHAKGIDILTGNDSLYYCQEVLNENIYNKILECAKEKYDFIILDTSSNIFLDSTRWCMQKASTVFFALENSYMNLKKATQMLDVYVNNWGILKSKISLIVNKEKINGISCELIEKILESYSVIGKIKNGDENSEIAYERILENVKFVPKTTLMQKIKASKDNILEMIDRRIVNKKEVVSDTN